MFTVAPIGSTKSTTPGETPMSLAHALVTGSVALLLFVPKAVTKGDVVLYADEVSPGNQLMATQLGVEAQAARHSLI